MRIRTCRRRFRVMGIPTLLVFKDGELADTLVGLRPKEEIAYRSPRSPRGRSGTRRERRIGDLSLGVSGDDCERNAVMADRKVVIIGSGPAGLTAALYTARGNLSPLLVEGLEAGGQLTLTSLVENYPGFRAGIQGPDLMEEMRQQAAHFGTEIVQGNVMAADLRKRPFTMQLADGRRITTETLIIATGASARWLDIGSDRKLSGRGVSTCATCDGYFFRNRPIAVVGGGDSAMEEAIYLSRLASKVTVIHRRDSLRASKIMQDKALKNPKIEFIWDSEIADVKDVDKGDVTGVVVRNLKTGTLTGGSARGRVHRHRPYAEHVALQGTARSGRERLHRHASRDADERAGRVRRR